MGTMANLYKLAEQGAKWLEEQGYLGNGKPADGSPSFRGPPSIYANDDVAEPRLAAGQIKSPTGQVTDGGNYAMDPEGAWARGADEARAPHSFKGGGDTYTKTAADWAQPGAFSKQTKLPPSLAPSAEDDAPAGAKSGQGGGPADPTTRPRARSTGPAGADPAVTGTASNPTAAMDEDEDLKKFADLIKKFQDKPTQVNLKPLMALTDAWTGSNLAGSYDAPMTQEQKDQQVLGMNKELLEKQAAMKYKKAYLTQQAEEARARQIFQDKQLAQQRELAEMAEGGRNARATAKADAKGAGNPEKARADFFKRYKGTFVGLAQKVYGKPGEKPDKSVGATYAGPMADHAWRYVQYLKENPHEIEEGMTAEEQAVNQLLRHPAGPDGVK